MSAGKIHVANVPLTVTEDELHALFVPFGNIAQLTPSAKLQRKFRRDAAVSGETAAETAASETTYAELVFEDPDDADDAQFNMNGYEIHGKFLIVTSSSSAGNAGNDSSVLRGLKDKRAIWDEENKDVPMPEDA